MSGLEASVPIPEGPATTEQPPVCRAAALREEFAMNDAAAAMSGAPTDETQEDQAFSPIEYCGACKGNINITMLGGISASRCIVSGSCEVTWTDMHPEFYKDGEGRPDSPKLPCGGSVCTAVIQLAGKDGSYQPRISAGECIVDVKGREYWEKGRAELDKMTATRPEDGLEVFDGEE